jgi:protoporphyrinogen oxidase
MKKTVVVQNKPILELSTTIERLMVAINGKPLELLSLDEMSFAQSAALTRLGEGLKGMAGADEATMKEVMVRLDEFLSQAVIGYEEFAAALKDAQKLNLLNTFTGQQRNPDRIKHNGSRHAGAE